LRNVEVMWLLGRLAPDHKTIADFRKDNGRAIRQVCSQFVVLCRAMGLLTEASVAIDGSKAVNNRGKNFTRAKMERRMGQIDSEQIRARVRQIGQKKLAGQAAAPDQQPQRNEDRTCCGGLRNQRGRPN
jgi:hypothetical protein